ncbi:MAG: HAD-IA family hydrolase [Gemmatimonadaceae bacterium]
MALDALIFDLDGTLVDTNDAHVEAWARAFTRCGYKVFPDRIRPEVGKGGDNLVPAILGEEADRRDGEALRAAVKEEFVGIAAGRRFRVFDRVPELLDALRRRGLKRALATSSGEEQLEAIFRSAGTDLRPLFDVVVGKADVERSKPDPDVVLAALDALGLSPAQCAMVGDTPHDAQSAKRAGVVTLGVLAGGLSDERTLVASGARRVWRDPAHLLGDLDEALRVASPGAAHLSRDVLEQLMREALDAAREGMAAGEAPIGCVIAGGDGRVLARGWNEQKRTGSRIAHAEIATFSRLAGRAPRASRGARDLIMVSTLEPCVMCTGAAMESAVDTIVFALRAPADSGTGRVRPPESPESQMPRIVGDVLAAESRALCEQWYAEHRGEEQAAYVGQLLTLTSGESAPRSTPQARPVDPLGAEGERGARGVESTALPLGGVLETALYVADPARSAEFYRRLLDAEVLFADERLQALSVAGRQVLLLFRQGASTEPVRAPGGVIPPHDGAGRLHVAFAVPEASLGAWEARLAEVGAAVESRVGPWGRGGSSLYFRDPDGHLVELATPGIWSIY